MAIGSNARPMSEKPKLRAFYEADSLHTEIGDALGASLAADGHEVVGIDLSAPMLRLAEQRREALSADAAARLSFHQADMRTLDLGRDFALIVTPARVFQFMLTSAAQREALAALR